MANILLIEKLTKEIEAIRIAAAQHMNRAEEKRKNSIIELNKRVKQDLLTVQLYGGKSTVNVDLNRIGIPEVFKYHKDILKTPRVKDIHTFYNIQSQRINNEYNCEIRAIEADADKKIKQREIALHKLAHA